MTRSGSPKFQKLIPLDWVASKIAALGVPGLIFVVASGATGLTGAAATTTALAAIGPAGMIGGLISLGIIGIIANTVSKYGLEKVVTAVVRELYKKGETRQSILTKIESYPITNTLRLKLKEELTTLDAMPGQNLTPRTDR